MLYMFALFHALFDHITHIYSIYIYSCKTDTNGCFIRLTKTCKKESDNFWFLEIVILSEGVKQKYGDPMSGARLLIE